MVNELKNQFYVNEDKICYIEYLQFGQRFTNISAVILISSSLEFETNLNIIERGSKSFNLKISGVLPTQVQVLIRPLIHSEEIAQWSKTNPKSKSESSAGEVYYIECNNEYLNSEFLTLELETAVYGLNNKINPKPREEWLNNLTESLNEWIINLPNLHIEMLRKGIYKFEIN